MNPWMWGIVRTLFRAVLWLGGIALVVGGVLNIFFVDRIRIRHNAMAPTLFFGDEALVWRSKSPEYSLGDVVVCAHPEAAGEFVMGRVMAKPGMTIEASRGQLRIAGTVPDRESEGTFEFQDVSDGSVYDVNYGTEKVGNRYYRYFSRIDQPLAFPAIQVEGGLFLLADHRGSSGYDSRTFGEVDPTTCIGTVFFRLRPGDHAPPEAKVGWLQIVR